jgi:hypothetical protein
MKTTINYSSINNKKKSKQKLTNLAEPLEQNANKGAKYQSLNILPMTTFIVCQCVIFKVENPDENEAII